MKSKKCSRFKMFIRELALDWDELNIAFKALLLVGIIIFFLVILMAIFNDSQNTAESSIESMFRTSLSSVFGFLLSSNFKKSTNSIEYSNYRSIKQDKPSRNDDDSYCESTDAYKTIDINIIQILVALFIILVSAIVIAILMVTNNLDNLASISQLRVLMSTSIGFLIGEAGKK